MRPWMTVKKALAEIEELRPTCDGSKARILEEYKAYLLRGIQKGRPRSVMGPNLAGR